MARKNDADVIVVGAGLAGLCAAREVVSAGASTLLLEARDRVGGRVSSHELQSGGVVDLGGQWLGRDQRRLMSLMTELGIGSYRQYAEGRVSARRRGSVRAVRASRPPVGPFSIWELWRTMRSLERLAAAVPPGSAAAPGRSGHLDKMTVAEWRDRHIRTADGRAFFDTTFMSGMAADPGEVSMLSALRMLASAGADIGTLIDETGGVQEMRVVGGAQTIADRIADDLGDRIRLSSPVRAIRQDGTGVRVLGDGFEVAGRFAIMTIPPPLLAGVSFEPVLPTPKALLPQRMPMGSVVKCIAVYDEPFWRGDGMNGAAVADTGPVRVIGDNCGPAGSPASLLAFVIGRDAREWAGIQPERRRELVLAEMAAHFGTRASTPLGYVEADWCADPWSRGCYACFSPPGSDDVARTVAAPVGAVHWAGTEAAAAWRGYMEGAVESGQRVGREVTGLLDE